MESDMSLTDAILLIRDIVANSLKLLVLVLPLVLVSLFSQPPI
jgi:hypothetical protein